MKIYNVERDHNISLEKQKKQLKKLYPDMIYLFSNGMRITFMAS